MKRAFLLLALLFLLVLPTLSFVYAHPGNTASDGCHYCRTNCDYWGEEYGERHCHGGYEEPDYSVPVYIPRIQPEDVQQGQWDFPISAVNWCARDVMFTWTKPEKATAFSISLSKYQGDPGPNADTTENKYTFQNVLPGKYYVNIKSYYLGTWGNIRYWNIEVPEVKPNFYTNLVKNENGENVLQYEFACIKSYSGPQELIDYLKNNNYKPKGDVVLTNTTGEFQVKGMDNGGNEHISTYSAEVKVASVNDEWNGNLFLAIGASLFAGYFLRSVLKK